MQSYGEDFIKPVNSSGYVTLVYQDELIYIKSFTTSYKRDVEEIIRMYALKNRAERRRLNGHEANEVTLNIHLKGKDEIITQVF